MNELREEISRLREKLAGSNLTESSSKDDVIRMQVKLVTMYRLKLLIQDCFLCVTIIWWSSSWLYFIDLSLKELIKDLQIAKSQTWDEKERMSTQHEEDRKLNFAKKVFTL